MRRTIGQPNRQRGRGFTLIELLVVVGIIALLLTVLLPTLQQARRQGKRAVCASNLRSLGQGMILYAMEQRDEMPLNEGAEPTHVYVRHGAGGDGQWLLAELIFPYIGYDPPPRSGPNRSFTDEDFERTVRDAEILYCPATDNWAINNANEHPNWRDHSIWGAYMDYAQFWNWVGPFVKRGSLRDDSLIVTAVGEGGGAIAVLDDEQQPIAPRDWPAAYGDYEPLSGLQYRLPHNLAREPLTLPGSRAGSRVPVMGDYVVSRGFTRGELSGAWERGELKPQTANHIWSQRTGTDTAVRGGSFVFADGSVLWRRTAELRPRLMLLRTFGGQSPYPTYWW